MNSIVKARNHLLFVSCLVVVSLLSCSGPTGILTEPDSVSVWAMVLPGRVSEGEEVLLKYVWSNTGGCLWDIGGVEVDRRGNDICVTPFGDYITRGSCPEELRYWWGTDTISLGLLSPGQYTVQVVGSDCTYEDELTVPVGADSHLFRFDVTSFWFDTGQPAEGIELKLWVDADSLPSSSIFCVTDSLGMCSFVYDNPGPDVVRYQLFRCMDCGDWWCAWRTILASEARKGTPEIITFGAL